MVYNVYTDGSFKEVDGMGIYSSAAVIYKDNGEPPIELTNTNSNQEYAKMRNVTGEVLAVFMTCEYLMNTCHITQEDEVVIHYDYLGVEAWLKNPGEAGYWKAKNSLTQHYRNYMNNLVKTRCKMRFEHVAGHTGNEGNERADRLAKQSIESYIAKGFSR